MDIKRGEFEKLYRNPILIVLVVIFLIYNGLIMYKNLDIREPLKITNELIREVGYEIDDDMLNKLEIKYEAGMKELNEMTESKFGKTYSSINEFMRSNEFINNNYREDVFSDKDKELINRISVINMYKNEAPKYILNVENKDIMKVAENTIESYGLTGNAAELVRSNFKEFGERLNKLINDGEHKNLYFNEGEYETHSLLFKDIVGSCIVEIMIIVVLGVSLLVNYERERKTLGLVIASKRGRKLLVDKLQVGLIFSVILTVLILGITLITYFNVFDYSEVWNIPISSALNSAGGVGNMSWYNLSFIQYLILAIILVFILGLLSAGLAFGLSSLLKSTYKSFFAFFILFEILFIVPSLFSKSSPLVIWSNFNMFVLALNPQSWFMVGPFIGSKHYVDGTLISNALIVIFLIVISIKRFKKENIS